jgi:hypothetical protein
VIWAEEGLATEVKANQSRPESAAQGQYCTEADWRADTKATVAEAKVDEMRLEQ